MPRLFVYDNGRIREMTYEEVVKAQIPFYPMIMSGSCSIPELKKIAQEIMEKHPGNQSFWKIVDGKPVEMTDKEFDDSQKDEFPVPEGFIKVCDYNEKTRKYRAFLPGNKEIYVTDAQWDRKPWKNAVV